ncbi:MAG: HNH endonuclease [Candidatus Brocadiales bacterium]
MAEWFRDNNIKDGDEVVVQLVDKEKFIYKLVPEHKFLIKTNELQKDFDESENEAEASEQVAKLAKWTDLDKREVVLNEYRRLLDTSKVEERRYVERPSSRAGESVPYNLRALLGCIYQGHCQVCDFWFLKRDNTPYFETHHLKRSLGNNPKNIVLVCANCHRQFEYAHVLSKFNDDNWLVMVSFNEKTYPVNQVVLKTELEDSFKKLFI